MTSASFIFLQLLILGVNLHHGTSAAQHGRTNKHRLHHGTKRSTLREKLSKSQLVPEGYDRDGDGGDISNYASVPRDLHETVSYFILIVQESWEIS